MKSAWILWAGVWGIADRTRLVLSVLWIHHHCVAGRSHRTGPRSEHRPVRAETIAGSCADRDGTSMRCEVPVCRKLQREKGGSQSQSERSAPRNSGVTKYLSLVKLDGRP